MKYVERGLHTKFARWRLFGEWFDLDAEIAWEFEDLAEKANARI